MGYTVLLIQGVTLSSAADAGVVVGTLPAMSALFAALFLGERPGVRMVAAIALATLGVMAVSTAPGAGAHASTRLVGIALVRAAIACEAVFILANKRLAQPIAALPLSTLMSAGGLLLSLLPAWWRHGESPSAFSHAALAGVLYYAWVPTVGGFLLWYAGSQCTSGARAALATVWLPVSALALSALVLGEPIRSGQWLGLACVLLAMWLAAPERGKRASD